MWHGGSCPAVESRSLTMARKLRLGVMLSGGGTTLLNILGGLDIPSRGGRAFF